MRVEPYYLIGGWARPSSGDTAVADGMDGKADDILESKLKQEKRMKRTKEWENQVYHSVSKCNYSSNRNYSLSNRHEKIATAPNSPRNADISSFWCGISPGFPVIWGVRTGGSTHEYVAIGPWGNCILK